MEDFPGNAYKALLLPLKRQDSEIRWMLAALAAGDVVGVAVVASIGEGGIVVLTGMWLVGTLMLLTIGFRFRLYSPGGLMWFVVGYFGFLGLTGSLTLVSVWMGWPPVQPVARYLIVQSVGLVPLLTAIALMSRKLPARAL